MQILRRHRRPVSGQALAAELAISLRTLYRDIASLQAQGARIDGEAGVGYLLHPHFTLPPLMFSTDEVEALALGAKWVHERADGHLANAARDALAKISAVLPEARRDDLANSALLVGPGEAVAAGIAEIDTIRRAIRAERKLHISYADAHGAPTSRTIWPIALAFFDRARVAVAWCELRGGYRHFRLDRITALGATEARYPRRRSEMFAEWSKEVGARES